jgi:hypothetical protein
MVHRQVHTAESPGRASNNNEMKAVLLALGLGLVAPGVAAGQPAMAPREVRFTGPTAADELCACLLGLRRHAEAQGRLDFTAEVQSAGADAPADLTARIWPGSPHAVGRIDFSGHSGINDSTLRRAMTIYERDLLHIGKLRRSLARINDVGVFEPITLADISFTKRDDGVTTDLTIPLRARKRRWWSLSAPMIPGITSVQASLASRLPPWGRGALEAATYFVSLNMIGFAKPFLVLQRPVIPGQELLSGFAISPALSPRATLRHYGLTHLAHRIGPMLDGGQSDPLAVPVISAGRLEPEPLICVPPKGRLWWLRRGASVAGKTALGAVIP